MKKILDIIRGSFMLWNSSRSRTTLGILRKTVVISLLVTMLLFASTIAIEVIGTDNHWLSTVQNIFIGVGCSLVVVVITSIIQFKAEINKLEEMFFWALYPLLSRIQKMANLDYDNIDKKEYYRIYGLVRDHYQKYDSVAEKMIWFSFEKNSKFVMLDMYVFMLYEHISNSNDPTSDKIMQPVDRDKLGEIIKESRDFADYLNYKIGKVNIFDYLMEQKDGQL